MTRRRIENFCKDHIGRIVRRNGVAQGPNSFQQAFVLWAFDIQGNRVFEGLPAAGRPVNPHAERYPPEVIRKIAGG